jgi:uncharacterized membrane protein
MTLVLAFLVGVVAGLRSMTPPAAVAWAAHAGRLTLRGSALAFLQSTVAVAAFTLLAIGELIVDKLPSTPARTKPAGLIARFVLGGMCGAAIAVSGSAHPLLGAVLGAAGGLVGAFAGYEARTRLVRALKVPAVAIALAEDAVAIAAALWIVSR